MNDPDLPRAAAPHVECVGERVYFTDEAGTRWRIYDVAFGDVAFGPPICAPLRRHAERPPWAPANSRWFVRADGQERCHRFARGEPREVTPERLARQLAAAPDPPGCLTASSSSACRPAARLPTSSPCPA